MSDQALQEPGGDARAQLRTYALTFPEAYEDYPWGEMVVKVQKKVFVFLGAARCRLPGSAVASNCLPAAPTCSRSPSPSRPATAWASLAG